MQRLIIGFVLALLAPLPAMSGAWAADTIFTVKDVPVDATAAASVEAQSIAINEGRPKAWSILYRRLTRQEDWARQPQLDNLAIQRLIRTFDISDERRSTKRYVAKVSYVFSQSAVERLLRSQNISYVVSTSRKVLVIPLSPTYQMGDSWSLVWRDPALSTPLVSTILPDENDSAALSGLTFDSANWAAIAPIALRLRAVDAVVAEATQQNGRVSVRLKRLAPGQPIQPVVEALGHDAAARAAFQVISDFWKNKSTVDFSQKSRLNMDVRFNSLSEWASLQSRLRSLQTVTGIDLVAFSIHEARINVAYVGTLDQLRANLAHSGLVLTSRAGLWWLTRSLDTAAAPQGATP